MRTALILLVLLSLAGCDKSDDPPPAIKPASGGRDLERWGPDEFGVACYRKLGMEGISCVKVAPDSNPQPASGQS